MAIKMLSKVLCSNILLNSSSSQGQLKILNNFNRFSKRSARAFHIHCTNSAPVNISLDPIQEQLLKENCILVDENDKVVGQTSKKDCHTVVNNSIPLHRAFSVFLFNENNELLIQQRSRFKITYPEYFTNTCCSHPLYDFEEELNEKNNIGIKLAAKRRLNYELGIPKESLNMDDIKCITRIHYFDKGDGVYGEHEIDHIIFVKKNVDICINKNEIQLAKYVGLEKMEEFLKNLHYPITPWFHFIVEYKLYDWWKNLDTVLTSPPDYNIHKF